LFAVLVSSSSTSRVGLAPLSLSRVSVSVYLFICLNVMPLEAL
jgi:hypothetical protein